MYFDAYSERVHSLSSSITNVLSSTKRDGKKKEKKMKWEMQQEEIGMKQTVDVEFYFSHVPVLL